MKKSWLLFVLLPLMAVAAMGQESRMDVSGSFSGVIPPWVAGSGAVYLHSTTGLGALFSYRYDLTPRSQLEANYGYGQMKMHFSSPSYNYMIDTRRQEVSFAYVQNFYYGNFNPFIEAGGGISIFTPIDSNKTTTSVSNLKQQMTPTALYGVGVAYELSPSWDLRVEYRGLISKTPDFGFSVLNPRRYYNVFNPVIGFAYHF